MWTYTGCCGHAHAGPDSYWVHHAGHHAHWYPVVSKELSAMTATPSAQANVGGIASVFLSLDYLKDPAAQASSVKVTITDPSGTGEWNITTIPDGFQEKPDFASAAPGATVKLDVTGCTAQLKWYERIS